MKVSIFLADDDERLIIAADRNIDCDVWSGEHCQYLRDPVSSVELKYINQRYT